MRVYFTGSHSCGKTTLCRYVSNKHSLPILPECARAVLAERELQLDILRSDIEAVNSYQKAVFCRQLEEESKRDKFVADRSLIDCIAYSAQHSQICHQLINDKHIDQYIGRLNNSTVFFIRPSKATLVNDGIREQTNWDAIVAIDAMIKFLFQMFDVKYHQISTDSMQERVQLVNAVLSLKTAK